MCLRDRNDAKTRLLHDGMRQTVTGIVVNEKPQVPASYRRKLRQEIYYCMEYGVFAHLERLWGRAPLPEEEEAYMPVSYTHLDVYKRQDRNSS